MAQTLNRMGGLAVGGNVAAHGNKLRVFISYSRRDLGEANALVAALEGEGFAVTIDRRDLPYGEEWQKELADFIRASDTVVWLVSPASVKSKWCNWELGEVGRLSKRLVPVRIGEVAPEELPEALGKIHLLPAEGVYAADQHLAPLAQALNTDRAWVKEATRLSDRAREWIARERNSGLLLRGPALANAERWSTRQPRAAPPPASETLELILASRRGATRRQRWTIAGALAVAAVSTSLAVFAWRERSVAVERRSEALRNESRLLIGSAERSAGDGNVVNGTHLALAALPDQPESVDRPYLPEAEQRLYRGLMDQRERFVFEPSGLSRPVAAWVSHDGKHLTTISYDNLLRTVDVKSGREIASAQGRKGSVAKALARSSDGKRLVVAAWLGGESNQQAAVLWDLEAGREVDVILGPDTEAESAAFSADGHRVAAVSPIGEVAISDAADGRRLGRLTGHAFRSAAFSPDGRLLATGDGRAVRLWDWQTGTELKAFEGHNSQVVAVFFTPDGARLVSASWDDTVRIWDVQTGQPLARLEGHSDIVLSAALSADGKWLLTGSQDKTARIWDIENRRSISPGLAGHTDSVVAVAFSPNGSRAITGANDGTVRIWVPDLGLKARRSGRSQTFVVGASEAPVASVEDQSAQKTVSWEAGASAFAVLRGHAQGIVSAAFAPDGECVVTVGDRTARVWDVESAEARGVLKGHDSWLSGVVFSPDSERLVTTSRDHTARLWDVRSGQVIRVVSQGTQSMVGAAFSPNGETLITVSENGTAQRWNGKTGEHVSEALNGLDNWSALSVLSRDGARLVTTKHGSEVATLWDVAAGRKIAVLKDPSGRKHLADVGFAIFSPDGARLATIAQDGDIKTTAEGGGTSTTLRNDRSVLLWNAVTGESLGALTAGRDPVHIAAFSPDGQRLATAYGAAGFGIWDLSTKQERLVLKHEAYDIAFSADGARIATASRWILGERFSRAAIWDAANGKELTRFVVPTPGMYAQIRVVFTPDGKRIVAIGRNTASLWDAQTGMAVAIFDGHTATIAGFDFTADGTRFVTASTDRTARVWPIFSSAGNLQVYAKDATPRCLTTEESRAFFLDVRIPSWCITGPGQESEPDSAKWRPKWPYAGDAWRQWLADLRAGKDPKRPDQGEVAVRP